MGIPPALSLMSKVTAFRIRSPSSLGWIDPHPVREEDARADLFILRHGNAWEGGGDQNRVSADRSSLSLFLLCYDYQVPSLARLNKGVTFSLESRLFVYIFGVSFQKGSQRL